MCLQTLKRIFNYDQELERRHHPENFMDDPELEADEEPEENE